MVEGTPGKGREHASGDRLEMRVPEEEQDTAALIDIAINGPVGDEVVVLLPDE